MYRNNVRNDIRQLRNQGNIQQYWKYIKKKTNGNPTKNDINFETFVDFFKNINTAQIDDLTYQDMPNNYEANDELDRPITEAEIVEAAKKLKSGKAVGGDYISNEQIKTSMPVLKSTYAKNFNIVFNEGVVPTAWVEGIIKPIYKKRSKKQPRQF